MSEDEDCRDVVRAELRSGRLGKVVLLVDGYDHVVGWWPAGSIHSYYPNDKSALVSEVFCDVDSVCDLGKESDEVPPYGVPSSYGQLLGAIYDQ